MYSLLNCQNKSSISHSLSDFHFVFHYSLSALGCFWFMFLELANIIPDLGYARICCYLGSLVGVFSLFKRNIKTQKSFLHSLAKSLPHFILIFFIPNIGLLNSSVFMFMSLDLLLPSEWKFLESRDSAYWFTMKFLMLRLVAVIG